jgi:hypothetical protein
MKACLEHGRTEWRVRSKNSTDRLCSVPTGQVTVDPTFVHIVDTIQGSDVGLVWRSVKY